MRRDKTDGRAQVRAAMAMTGIVAAVVLRPRPVRRQMQGSALVLLWALAFAASLWLGGCAPAPRSQSGRPASVSAGQNVYRAVFPLLESGLRWLFEAGLGAIRPDQAVVADPQEEIDGIP